MKENSHESSYVHVPTTVYLPWLDSVPTSEWPCTSCYANQSGSPHLQSHEATRRPTQRRVSSKRRPSRRVSLGTVAREFGLKVTHRARVLLVRRIGPSTLGVASISPLETLQYISMIKPNPKAPSIHMVPTLGPTSVSIGRTSGHSETQGNTLFYMIVGPYLTHCRP